MHFSKGVLAYKFFYFAVTIAAISYDLNQRFIANHSAPGLKPSISSVGAAR